MGRCAHDVPPVTSGILDVAGYYGPFVELLDRATRERFVRPEHRRLLVIDADPDALLDRLEAWEPAPTDKWIDRSER